jgi:ABC-2 type transport system permease protein
VIVPEFKMTLRLRAVSTVSAGIGMIFMLIIVGALFPAVGHSIGRLKIPKGVSELLGGADYGTITGWYRSEVGSIYGPLVIAGLAIVGAAATTAGEEEDRILALVLAHPVERRRLVVSKAAAIALVVLITAAVTLAGLLAGVALAGGGISTGHLAAYTVQLAFFGFATGAVALAVGAGTGRRALANGVAGAFAIAGWLINGFAPLVGAIAWLKYLSLFHYYAAGDQLTGGIDLGAIAVLGLFSLALVGVAMLGLERRDLRA